VNWHLRAARRIDETPISAVRATKLAHQRESSRATRQLREIERQAQRETNMTLMRLNASLQSIAQVRRADRSN
jgi:hypothetical protein